MDILFDYNRKTFLGYAHIRKAWNNEGLNGIPHPNCDSIKLYFMDQNFSLVLFLETTQSLTKHPN